MARKPDYFEKMVEKATVCDLHTYIVVLPKDAVKLLRRYHAKVRRMVKDTLGYRYSRSGHGFYQCGKGALWLDREELLRNLDRLKKGQP